MFKHLMAVATLAIAAPLIAQTPALDPEIATWADRISAQLDANLERSAGPVGDASGLVTVKFNCTEDGKASNIAVLKSSGNRRIDRAAMQAVKMVRSFHPLPRGLGHGQPIVAILSYDTQEDGFRRHQEEGRQIAHAGNTWYRSDRYAKAELPPLPHH